MTIAKAGICATLNARCSVVAAANPCYGQYRKDKTAGKNITIPTSLLSRFDFVFIMVDEIDLERDTEISSDVLDLHRLRKEDKDFESRYLNESQLLKLRSNESN